MGQIIEFAKQRDERQGYLSCPSPGTARASSSSRSGGPGRAHQERLRPLRRGRLRGAAPDLYRGQSTTEPDEAAKEMMALELDRAARDMSGRSTSCGAGPTATRWGHRFCMGGDSPSCSPVSALTRSQRWCRATASSRGPTPNPTTRCCQLPSSSSARPRTARSRPSRQPSCQRPASPRKDAEVIVHPGAEHAFFNDDRPECTTRRRRGCCGARRSPSSSSTWGLNPPHLRAAPTGRRGRFVTIGPCLHAPRDLPRRSCLSTPGSNERFLAKRRR